jgi:hypothetical protein
VAQFVVALAILLGAMLCVYAVERVWFGQRRWRAMSIATSNDGAIFVLPVVITVLGLIFSMQCFYLARKLIFGRRTADRMQPAIFLRRICAALEFPTTR